MLVPFKKGTIVFDTKYREIFKFHPQRDRALLGNKYRLRIATEIEKEYFNESGGEVAFYKGKS